MDKSLVKAVINTLDTIAVSGHENWDKMLGCYNALNSILADSEEKKETTNA